MTRRESVSRARMRQRFAAWRERERVCEVLAVCMPSILRTSHLVMYDYVPWP